MVSTVRLGGYAIVGKWARGARESGEEAGIGLLSLREEIVAGGLMTARTCNCGTKPAVGRFPARHSECCWFAEAYFVLWQDSSYDCGQDGDNRNIHCFYRGSHVVDQKALDVEQIVEQHWHEVVIAGTCFSVELVVVCCFVFCWVDCFWWHQFPWEWTHHGMIADKVVEDRNGCI